MAVYSATKAYVLSFGEALAAELAGSGVTVTTLAPGSTNRLPSTGRMGERAADTLEPVDCWGAEEACDGAS